MYTNKDNNTHYIHIYKALFSVIEEANWLSMKDDLTDMGIDFGKGYDAVICLGNSFAHLPDFNRDGKVHKLALNNFESLVKPGGILMIDHRNYDAILKYGSAPSKNIYYNVSMLRYHQINDIR